MTKAHSETRAIVEAVAGIAVTLRVIERPATIFERLSHEGSELMLVQRGEIDARVLGVAADVSHGFVPGCELTLASDPRPFALSVEQLERLADALQLRPPPAAQVIESGIKVIDVISPLVDGGSTWLIGGPGVGRIKCLEELHARLVSEGRQQTLVFLIVPADAHTIAPTVAADGFPPDCEAGLRVLWLVCEHAKDPALAERATLGSTRLVFTPELAARDRWPAIDPQSSRSVAGGGTLATEVVAALEAVAHLRGESRQSADDEQRALTIADTLERYFAQPFDAAFAFTSRAGTRVAMSRAQADCRLILAGGQPEAGFDFES